MNKRRLSKLADWLEAGAPHKHIRFDMSEYLVLQDAGGCYTDNANDACGAVCCIAGAAAQFFAPAEIRNWSGDLDDFPVFEVGRKSLGLTISQADDLFVPPRIELSWVTPEEAGKVVRNLIKTGRVDWRVAGYEVRA